jgi:hypothetical protein
VESANEPGLCLAVHGPEDAGQFAFLSFLEQWNPWDISGAPHGIRPSFDEFDVTSLTAASLGEIASGRASASATIESLAAAILDRSEREPVVMFLRHLSLLEGGLEALHDQFWRPLMGAARARRSAMARPCRPFALVVVVSAPLEEPLPPFVAAPVFDGNGPTDFDRVIALPELEPLTAGQIMRWLDGVGVRNLKERKAIADRTIGDGMPRGVFDRLNSEAFWPPPAR